MNMFEEVQGNALEHISKDSPLVHCISSDYALGAGIAQQVQYRFNIKPTLFQLGRHIYPDVIRVDNIINLVTKNRCFNKPTYDSFSKALEMCGGMCKANHIKHVVMPRIGCGLDRLDWEVCKNIINKTLVSQGIAVTVYYL